MRGLAEALATAARNARTTGTPFVQSSKRVESAAAESWQVEKIEVTQSKRENVTRYNKYRFYR